MSKFEVIRGVEDCCLALDDTRIAGPKPWGGGTVIHAWETDKEYKAVDTHSRWHELFGTPERAAHYFAMQCFGSDGSMCCYCPFDGCNSNLNNSGSYATVYNALLEWLRGDA